MDAIKVAEQFEKSAQKEAKGERGNIGTTMRQMLRDGVSDETLLTGMSMAAGFLPKTA
jgi:hypothetical protein|tara:strand:+ start:1084 stop:1257 length:174 start_codon:yes stop_codon:yes gene_type:complete